MAIEISELGKSRDGKAIPAKEFEVREFILERLINKIPGLLFGINRKQGVVEDRGSAYGLSPERMQELGIELMEDFGFQEEKGRKVPDETDEGDDVTVFEAPDRVFERRICLDLKTGEKSRVRWFQEFPETQTSPQVETLR